MSGRSILITGGAGFIGSHVVRRFVTKYPQHRIVNLDLLTYGDLSYDGWELRVPHPGLYQRAFVLVPLLELEPDFRHPETGEPARAALARLSEEDRAGTWRL